MRKLLALTALLCTHAITSTAQATPDKLAERHGLNGTPSSTRIDERPLHSTVRKMPDGSRVPRSYRPKGAVLTTKWVNGEDRRIVMETISPTGRLLRHHEYINIAKPDGTKHDYTRTTELVKGRLHERADSTWFANGTRFDTSRTDGKYVRVSGKEAGKVLPLRRVTGSAVPKGGLPRYALMFSEGGIPRELLLKTLGKAIEKATEVGRSIELIINDDYIVPVHPADSFAALAARVGVKIDR